MDERSARATMVTAYVAFLAYVGILLWFLYRRLAPPAREPARVFRLVPADADPALETAPPPSEPDPAPKKKGR